MFLLSLIIFIPLYFILTSNLRKRVDTLENRVTFLEKGVQNVSVTNSAPSAGQIPSVVPAQPASGASIPYAQPTQQPQHLPVVETQAHSMETFANRMAKLGVVVLAIGVLYFLSYINSKGWLTEVAKFTIGLAAGAACVGIAEWVKRKSLQYAQILRGGGFIIWYITLYIGTFVYHITTLPVTLGLIVGILFISALVSLAEKKETSFFLGVLGAYIVPWIAGVATKDASTNLQILIYLLIINCGIIGLSIFQNWRKSVTTGFFFTWMMFLSIWSVSKGWWLGADMQLTWSTLWLFATLFGLQFLIVFLMGDIRRGRQYAVQAVGVDSSVKPKVKEGEVFLTATNTFVYVWFSYFLVMPHLKAYIGFLTLLLGVFHLGVYLFIRKMQGNMSRSVSSLTHFVIFIVLVTAAIPMQFDGPLVTMVWFIEGVVLAYLATTSEFKNRAIMYVLGFAGIVLGVMHMIIYGSYTGVAKTGMAVINQQYLVWFFVAALIHFIAYLWKDLEKVKSFALFLFLLGQVFFVTLSSVEIWSYYSFKTSGLYAEQQANAEEFRSYYGYSVYDSRVTPAQQLQFDQEARDLQDKTRSLSNVAAFINALFFVIMTTIYLLIGLMGQNKTFRRLGVVMLIITLIQIVSLVWQFGPLYRFVTFTVFGIVLLILSYLYIRHSKQINPPNETK